MTDTQRLRHDLRRAFDAAVRAADPAKATRDALDRHRQRIEDADRVFIAALGKAAPAMAEAASDIVGEKLAEGLIVTTSGAARDTSRFRTIVGGHPIPDAGSLEGGKALLDLAGRSEQGDLFLALISGGGSALAVAPRDGLSLADKARINDLLIRSGADITEINAVRRALSRLKGGGLARAAAPAHILGLILSDVPGDAPADVASGPTAAADGGTSASEVLEKYSLTGAVDASLLVADERPAPVAHNEIIASNALSVASAGEALSERGYHVIRWDGWLGGDVADAAEFVRRRIEEAEKHDGPVALVAGGETTVVVRGDGRGGRNQEFALRLALYPPETPRTWTFLSGGTDGRDGPTDAAGGFADAGSTERMRSAGRRPQDDLARNNAYEALDAAGDLLMTGATGTNVADVQIAVIA